MSHTMDYFDGLPYNWSSNKNIGILRMTGEVTDRFNEIILFGMAFILAKSN